jgi:hypothetical protein
LTPTKWSGIPLKNSFDIFVTKNQKSPYIYTTKQKTMTTSDSEKPNLALEAFERFSNSELCIYKDRDGIVRTFTEQKQIKPSADKVLSTFKRIANDKNINLDDINSKWLDAVIYACSLFNFKSDRLFILFVERALDNAPINKKPTN